MAAIILILIVLVFAGLRVVGDVPDIASGRRPDPALFEYRYVAYPWLAYAHILPGIVYLLLAPLQLWRGFRSRHVLWHRRIGRVALVAGWVSGVFGIVFGLFLAFGGPVQATASTLFGAYFVVALTLAYRAIRQWDVQRHRRWMIRAFALGLAVGTIRLWIGLFQALGLLSFQDSFGIAFWLAFTLHATAAELWLRARPSPVDGRRAGDHGRAPPVDAAGGERRPSP
jgi:uncharacterized membrane protein YozB (DUF420 family)